MSLKQIDFEDNNIKLFIVGDGPERQNLEILVKKLKLENHVVFTGQLVEDELNDMDTTTQKDVNDVLFNTDNVATLNKDKKN